MFYRIGFFCLFCLSLFGAEHIYLKTPNISRENIIGTNVGIRPFRKTGVRLEAELLKDKLIIHNYGYGGSGLTLAFGGAKEVLDILDKQKISSKTVAILGAGVVGLATAYDLLERGYEVHIYADEWSPNLTSNVAAGIWSPLSFPTDISEEKKKLHQRMLEVSEDRFLKSTGDIPEFAGIRFICSYSFNARGTQESMRTREREEIIAHFDNGTVKKGRRIDELGIEGKLFIEDLYSKVESKGATLQNCQFKNLEDVLSLEEPIIINCTSMGSIKLFNDQEFVPVRGQIIYFKPQNDIDYLLFQNVNNAPNDSNLFFVSIYPWRDQLILGGVYEQGKEDLLIDEEIIDKIIQNAEMCLSGTLSPSPKSPRKKT